MGRLILLSVIALIFSLRVNAQDIKITEEASITKLMERFVQINKLQTKVEGWRIQLLATTDRQKLESARISFQYRYPNVSVDWVHSKPYYKLRAGAFATKLEALHLKYVLEKDYTGIYLVKDNNINPVELINN